MRLKPKSFRIGGRIRQIKETKAPLGAIDSNNINDQLSYIDIDDSKKALTNLLGITEEQLSNHFNQAEMIEIDRLMKAINDDINFRQDLIESDADVSNTIDRLARRIVQNKQRLNNILNKEKNLVDVSKINQSKFSPDDFYDAHPFSISVGHIEQQLLDDQWDFDLENFEFVDPITGKKVKLPWHQYEKWVGDYTCNYTFKFGGLWTGSKAWLHGNFKSLSRQDKKKLIKDLRRRDAMINQLIRAMPGLSEDAVIFRGGRLNAKEIGEIGQFDYITSASFNENTSRVGYVDKDKGEYLIKILAPKGSKMAGINESGFAGHGTRFESTTNKIDKVDDQNEVLLARGQKYVVLDIDPIKHEATVMLIDDIPEDYQSRLV